MDYLLDNELTSEYDVASCNTYFLRSTFLVAGTKELNSFSFKPVTLWDL